MKWGCAQMKFLLSVVARVLSRVYRMGAGQAGKKNSKIMMFHYVTDCVVDEIKIHPFSENKVDPSCHCTTIEFVKILDVLEKEGYIFISMDECLKQISKKSYNKKCVISFDDATDDVYNIAYPILKQRKIPFIVYIPTGFISKKGCITKCELQKMAKDILCTIGSHTIHHVKLRDSMIAKQEIFDSKKMLEDIIGSEVKHFAYPWGTVFDVSLKNIFWVRKAGYKSAVGTVCAPLNCVSTFCDFYLPRINMSQIKDKLY